MKWIPQRVCRDGYAVCFMRTTILFGEGATSVHLSTLLSRMYQLSYYTAPLLLLQTSLYFVVQNASPSLSQLPIGLGFFDQAV